MSFNNKRIRQSPKISVDLSQVKIVHGNLNDNMRLNGWAMIEYYNGDMLLTEYADGEISSDGYLVNKTSILKTYGIEIDEKEKTEGTLTSESGLRFEGTIYNNSPFGPGSLLDSSRNIIFTGILIDWKKMGWGTSFYPSGEKSYEGYWCDDLKCGYGTCYSTEKEVIYEGEWINDAVAIVDYVGNGSMLHTLVKKAVFRKECALSQFDVSVLTLLENLVIEDSSFVDVPNFHIKEANELKYIKIGRYSFSKGDEKPNSSHSFSIISCPKLVILEIGSYSFTSYGGEFTLRDLPSLESIRIGKIGGDSLCFPGCSFVLQSSLWCV